jgi:hypothetical protein
MSSQAESRTLNAATIVFFAAFLLIGLLVFRDYGISWDEIPTRQFGIMYVTHAVPNAEALDSVRAVGGPAFERFGPVFEILLVRAEALMHASDIRNVFYMRHLATFLTFFVGVVLFHRLCRRRFGPGIALLACVCLVVSPQLFSHSFYNVKDISFLTMFVASMLTLDTLLERPEWRTILVHGLTTAILLGTRVIGVFAMLLTGAAALLRRPTGRTLLELVAYGLLVGLLLPLVWPVLQIDFFGIVISAVAGSTSNPYTAGDLFRGIVYSASALPRDYVPTWILITTPLIVSALFIVGTFSSVAKIARNAREYIFHQQRDLIVLCWFFLPVLGCVVLRPILYDGWRHLFFVYPAMVYLAAAGMETIDAHVTQYLGVARKRTGDAVLTVGLLLCLTPVVSFMVRNHPFEHVYFNRFAGSDMKEIKQRYELDYWGLSYRKALEYIVRSDSSSHIRIFTTTYPGRVNIAMLPASDRNRLELVHTDSEADYVMTNYRFHPQDYPYPREVFRVMVGNASINSVFLVRPNSTTPPSPMPSPAGDRPK